MEWNEKLQELRKQKGLTQEELAAQLHVSRTAVSKWESGRGYPGIDSLKALAKYFSITIDDLLSGNELLTLAEEDRRQQTDHYQDLIFGLSDACSILLLFLPFFAQRKNGLVQNLPLTGLSDIAPYIKALFLIFVLFESLWGIATLAFQNCQHPLWAQMKTRFSLIWNAAGLLLFIVCLQPYAAVWMFALLTVKGLLLLKKQ